MANEQRRDDISDKVWTFLEIHLPRQQGRWSGVAKDNRLFINTVFWILRTGAHERIYPRLTESGKSFTSVFVAERQRHLGSSARNICR